MGHAGLGELRVTTCGCHGLGQWETARENYERAATLAREAAARYERAIADSRRAERSWSAVTPLLLGVSAVWTAAWWG